MGKRTLGGVTVDADRNPRGRQLSSSPKA